MKKWLVTFGFLFFFLIAGLCQKAYVNELTDIVNQNKQDSASAAACNWLAFMGSDYNISQSKAAEMTEKAFQISEHINNKTQKAFALLNKSLALTAKGKYDLALITGNQAKDILNLSDTLKNTEVLSIYHFTIGMILMPQGSFKEETLANFLKALSLAKKTDNSYLKSVCYSSVGKAFDFLRQFEHEIGINKEFLNFASTPPIDTLILAKAYNNLGSAYMNAGDQLNAEKNYSEFELLLPHVKSPYLSWIFKNNKAHRLIGNQQNQEAIQSALDAIEIIKNNNLSPLDKLATYYLLGYMYSIDNDLVKSKAYLDTTFTIAQEVESKEYEMYAVSGLATVEGLLGNYKSSAEYLTRQNELSDSISNEKSKINANFLNIQYQTERKEAEMAIQNERLRQKNILNYILIGGVIALVLIMLLGFRNYNSRQKLQKAKIAELETEKQLLATQSLLKGQEEERSRIAKDLHDGLGGLLSGVKLQLGAMKGNLILTEENGTAFNRVLNNLEESISEMRRVAHNMMPETLLKFGLQQALTDYGNGLSHQQSFTIQCEFRGMEKRLDNTTEVVIYRIVQELINNAVKHSEATSILVQLMRHDEEHLNITVEDNGKGFEVNKVQTNSAGLRNIASRVKYLNGKMDVQSELGNGTSIYIECEIKSYG